MQAERLVILDEIANKLSDPDKVCKDYLAELIYGNHPYSLPVEGTPEMIHKITRQDILDYYHKRYVPADMAIVLAGDVNVQRTLTNRAVISEPQQTHGSGHGNSRSDPAGEAD